MADKHVVRLSPGRLGFYDPVNLLHLMYPNKMVGELPLDADLTYVLRAVKSGSLIDVNGTILGSAAKPETGNAVSTSSENKGLAESEQSVLEPEAAAESENDESSEDEEISSGEDGVSSDAGERPKKAGRRKR